MYEDAIHAAGHYHRRWPDCRNANGVIVCNDSTIKGGTYYPHDRQE